MNRFLSDSWPSGADLAAADRDADSATAEPSHTGAPASASSIRANAGVFANPRSHALLERIRAGERP